MSVSLLRRRRPSMRVLLIALAAVALAGPVQAQGQNNYGSIYSLYGMGERQDLGSSQSAMMGHAGVAVRSGVYTGLVNPALWADLGVTTFSAGASLTSVRAQDGRSDETSIGTAGDLQGLHLGIPLLPGRLGATVAYGPYSRVNFRATTLDSLDVDGTSERYTINREGAGGLQQLRAGLGLRIGSAVQVGASGDLIFGTHESLRRTDFESTGFVETREARATRVHGFSATLGATATAINLASDDDALTVGAAVTLPTSLSTSLTETLGESLDRDTLLAPVDGEATLPLSVRGGVSYQAGRRWLASLDALYEPWSQFDSTLPVGGFDPATGLDALQDRFRLGGGVEVTPAGRDLRAGVLRRTAYRLGAYAERGLYAPAGEDVTTLALTGGLSVPNRFTGARFDLGFEIGTRGSAEDVLVRDTFVKGTFTLNFGERWFIQRRFN